MTAQINSHTGKCNQPNLHCVLTTKQITIQSFLSVYKQLQSACRAALSQGTRQFLNFKMSDRTLIRHLQSLLPQQFLLHTHLQEKLLSPKQAMWVYRDGRRTLLPPNCPKNVGHAPVDPRNLRTGDAAHMPQPASLWDQGCRVHPRHVHSHCLLTYFRP